MKLYGIHFLTVNCDALFMFIIILLVAMYMFKVQHTFPAAKCTQCSLFKSRMEKIMNLFSKF